MKRRAATSALAAIALTSLAARAQPGAKAHRIGFLGSSSPKDYKPYLDAFLAGLKELGYEDGRNVVIDYRWAEGREDRLGELATQLVQLRPDVLVTHSIGINAAQKATSTIPIVMGASADPVAFGLVKSLAKPGGNTTGVAMQVPDTASKRLQVLKEAVPGVRSVAVLSNPAIPATAPGLRATEAAGRTLGVRVHAYDVTVEAASLEAAFAAAVRDGAEALVVQPDAITGKHSAAIARFAAKQRLPTIGGGKQFADEGGMLSYGSNFVDGWRLASRYVDRILKGAKPADLPIEHPATFELIVNARTARALGIVLPPTLLLRANEVIR